MSGRRTRVGGKVMGIRPLDAFARASRAAVRLEALEAVNFTDDHISIADVDGLYVEDVGGGGARRALGGALSSRKVGGGGGGGSGSAAAAARRSVGGGTSGSGGTELVKVNRARKFRDVLSIELGATVDDTGRPIFSGGGGGSGAGAGSSSGTPTSWPTLDSALAAAKSAPRGSAARASAMAVAHWLAAGGAVPAAEAKTLREKTGVSLPPPFGPCDACGAPSRYSCVRCGERECSASCGVAHRESRCR